MTNSLIVLYWSIILFVITSEIYDTHVLCISDNMRMLTLLITLQDNDCRPIMPTAVQRVPYSKEMVIYEMGDLSSILPLR